MKKHFLLLLAACLCCLVSCQTFYDGSDDENDNPMRYVKGGPVRSQLVSPYIDMIGYKPWSAQLKEDAALTGEGGDFQYWWEHRGEVDDNVSREAMCTLPQEQLAKMSTRNLVNTCFIYPYGSMLGLQNNPFLAVLQHMNRFNGLVELQTRKSAPAELIRLFKECKYPKDGTGSVIPIYSTDYLSDKHMLVGLPYLMILLETAVDCDRFSSNQIRELAGATLTKIDDIYSNESYSYFTKKYPLILGALIVYHCDGNLKTGELDMIKQFLGIQESNSVFYMNGLTGYPSEIDPATGQLHCTEEMVARHAALIRTRLELLSR